MATLFAGLLKSRSHTGAVVVRRSISLLLALAVWGAGTVSLVAKTSKSPDPAAVEAKVRKLGVGEHVMVKLATGAKLRGHIAAIGDQFFALRADRTNSETQISYDQVLQVKKNPGPLGWMLIGAALTLIIIAVAR
jgi:hypothetical protein